MIHDLLSPFYQFLASLPFESLQSQFMQRAVLEMLLIAPLCAIMGTLTVQFRMAFFSDAIAHSAFTGIALGMLLGVNPWISMIVFGVFVGVLTTRIRRRADLAMDTTLGVLFSTTVALGLAIISAKKGLGKSLPTFLYGDILSVSDGDVFAAFLLLVVVGVFLWFAFNRLLYLSLHEHLARASGIEAEWLETLFAAMLALVVAFTIRSVGILLVTALLVIPAAAAGNLSQSMRRQVWTALLISLLSCIGGMATSVSYDVATGAAIILWSSTVFGISLFCKKRS